MRHSIPSTAAEAVRHLYVHVPFCPTICPFCSFHVLERTGSLVEIYLDTLERELESIARTVDLVPDTVYVGGGTPSYLKPGEIERVVAMIDDRFGWARMEATLEVHPSTATAERVTHWTDLGFDRLSVGVQSFDDAVLRRLGRPHTAGAAVDTVSWCVQRPTMTSLDVISAVPGQSLEDELAAAIDLGVDHVSVYTLTIEEGTPFQRAGVTVDNDVEVAAIETAASMLTAAGFERYEVSNYARPGARSVHNQAYWMQAPFLGVGPSAASMVRSPSGTGLRWSNPVMADWVADVSPEVVEFAGRDLMGDALFCGLRLVEGVDLGVVTRRCGVDPASVFRDELATLQRDGLVEITPGRLRATPAGLLVLDQVASMFIDG